MKVFFDTNVLLDGYYQRTGAAESDQAIMTCQQKSGFRGWIAWHTLSNAYYMVRGHSKSKPVAAKFISGLLAWTEIARTDKTDALTAVSYGMTDFEDALQLAAAMSCQTDVFLTRNTTDFKASPIPVMTPEEFLAAYATAALPSP